MQVAPGELFYVLLFEYPS